VSVGRELEAVPVSHLCDRRNLLGRHLRFAGFATVGKHRAGSDHLQQIGTARNRQFGLLAELLRPARNSHPLLCRNFGFRMAGNHEIPASAGYRQVQARDLHAWPWRLAPIDFIANCLVGPRCIAADVAHRREPREQRPAGVLA